MVKLELAKLPPRLKVSMVDPDRSFRPVSIERPEQAAAVARDFIGDDPRECFIALYTDPQGTLIAPPHLLAIGNDHAVMADPKSLFAPAFYLNAFGLAVAHNHPAGDTTPSEGDRQVYQRLKKVGEMVGIHVLGCVVVSKTEWSNVVTAPDIPDGMQPFIKALPAGLRRSLQVVNNEQVRIKF